MRTKASLIARPWWLLAWLGLTQLDLGALDDPFADLEVAPVIPEVVEPGSFWGDNLLLRKELYLLLGAGDDTWAHGRGLMSRVSAGFEVQKRFSTRTRTVALVDYQGRVVYRNRSLDSRADSIGHGARPWKYEMHNAYLDLYNIVGTPGRVNLRLGHFYQPFGLGYQTDTHGTLLQLSQDMLFGAAHDWQAVAYGTLSEHLDYAAGYLLGAGHDHKWAGQSGMAVARIMLNNDWLFEHGLEGGVSVVAGERVDKKATLRSRAVGERARTGAVVRGWRSGADLRKRLDSSLGPFTMMGETALGQDEDALLAVNLAQADWLHPGRQWGAAMQYRHFWQEREGASGGANEARITGVITHYFRNEVGSANLHWLALGVERAVHTADERNDTLVLLQYYRYW